MGKQNIKEYDKSYHPPETIKLDYCAAVLAVVLEQHPKAKELFKDTKDCMLLPGVQEAFSTIERKIPESDKLIKGMVKKAGYKKDSKPEDNSAKSARRIIVGTLGLINGIKNKLMLPLLISSRRRHDLKALARSVDIFIRVCFNSESARAKGNYQITGNTAKTLSQLLFVRALLDTNEKYSRMFKRMGKIPMFKHGKKRFDVNKVLDGKVPALAQRALIKQYMDAGFKLKHSRVIETTAWRWYQCRVVHDGPTGYYYKQLKQTTTEDPVIVQPENLLHELKDFDEALGYSREKTGKRKNQQV
jgi:hypothetical protein